MIKTSIDSLLKVIRAPKPAASSELREALTRIDIGAAEAGVDQLEADRQRLLLGNAPDTELDAIEIKIKTANRNVEKLGVAKTELVRLIAEADLREAAQQVEAQAAEAQRATEKLALIYAEIDSRATQVRALLGDAAAPVSTLARWNKLAEKIGQPERRIVYGDPLVVKRKLVGTFQ